MRTTDTPLSMEQAAEALLEPIEATETDEAPDEEIQESPETQEAEAADVEDASEVEDDNSDETDDADDADKVDEDDEPEQASDGGDALHDVIVNGEKSKQTLQELKNNFSGRAALQERHEALRAEEAKVQETQASLQQQTDYVLQLYQQAQSSGFTPPPQKPDPALAQTDFVAYVEAQAQYEAANDQYQAEQQKTQFLLQQQEAQKAEMLRQHMRQQEQQLLSEMPELGEPAKAQEFKESLTKASKDYGFSAGEMQQIVTHLPSVKALYDAARYRKLQAEKETAKATREAPKSVTKPKAKPRDGGKAKRTQEIRSKARRTQSTEDWAAMLFE